jgi:hypothetical protein
MTHPHIDVHKISAFVSVSEELLMDMGIIPDTRPPSPPPTRRQRFRWWRAGQREKIARWCYEKISGEEMPDPEDYW